MVDCSSTTVASSASILGPRPSSDREAGLQERLHGRLTARSLPTKTMQAIRDWPQTAQLWRGVLVSGARIAFLPPSSDLGGACPFSRAAEPTSVTSEHGQRQQRNLKYRMRSLVVSFCNLRRKAGKTSAKMLLQIARGPGRSFISHVLHNLRAGHLFSVKGATRKEGG